MARDTDETVRPVGSHDKRGFPFSPKQVVGIVVLVVVAIFCAQNTDDQTITFFGASFESPLWVWLLGVLALGVLVGLLLPFGRSKRD